MSNERPTPESTLFPIRELSARTQVNTVTIRAWERRYGLLKPQRTSKGHRLYSDDDVRKVEQILELVARGVPLGKVKSLLAHGSDTDASEDSDTWNQAVKQLIEAAEAFSKNRLEALLNECFLSYPPALCRQKLVEPALLALQKSDNSQAPYCFAESEMLRYAMMRLMASKPQKDCVHIMLVCGDKAPLWRLAIMALELGDASYTVHLIARPFDETAWLEMASNVIQSLSVYYQDGIWRDNRGDTVAQALAEHKHLLVCGTAPTVLGIDREEQVFPDPERCTHFLLNRVKP